MVPEQPGQETATTGLLRRLLRGLCHLFFELLDAHLRVVESMLLYEQGLHEQVRRIGLRRRGLLDELRGLLVFLAGIDVAQAVEQTRNEIAFFGCHGL